MTQSIRSQNSRIYTLLETYGCEDCMISGVQDIEKSRDLNWEACTGKGMKASKSKEWLNVCLKGMNDEV